jgi:hypothetical protein
MNIDKMIKAAENAAAEEHKRILVKFWESYKRLKKTFADVDVELSAQDPCLSGNGPEPGTVTFEVGDDAFVVSCGNESYTARYPPGEGFNQTYGISSYTDPLGSTCRAIAQWVGGKRYEARLKAELEAEAEEVPADEPEPGDKPKDGRWGLS